MIRSTQKLYHAMTVSDVVGFNIEDKEHVERFVGFAESPWERDYNLNLILSIREEVDEGTLKAARLIWNNGQIEAARGVEDARLESR